MSANRMGDIARHELTVTSKFRASPILEWTKMTSRAKDPFFMPPSGGANVPPHGGEPIRRRIPMVTMDGQVGREFYTREQREELEIKEEEREAARRAEAAKPKLMYGPSADELQKQKDAAKKRAYIRETQNRRGKEIGRHCGVNMTATGGRSQSPGNGASANLGPALLLGPDDMKPSVPGGSFSKAGIKEGRSAFATRLHQDVGNNNNSNGLVRPHSGEDHGDDSTMFRRNQRGMSLPNLSGEGSDGGALNNTNITTLTKGCTFSRAVTHETIPRDRPDLNVNVFSVKPNSNANVSIDFKRMASRASPIPGGISGSLNENPKMSDKYRALFKKYQRSNVAVDRTHFKVRPRLSPLETRGSSKRDYTSSTRRTDDLPSRLQEAENACKRAATTMSLYFENPKTRSESRSALFYNNQQHSSVGRSSRGDGMMMMDGEEEGVGGDYSHHYHHHDNSNTAPTENDLSSY